MINIEQVALWFPEAYRKKQYFRYMYREFLQYKILDYIANSQYNKSLSFIGGTCLRLLYGIDRFSEDLDFDHKNMDKQKFIQITDSVIRFLEKSGYKVKADDKVKDGFLNAYRRNIIFPEFLYQNKLSPFKEEKFLIKIESQNQEKDYSNEKSLFKGCGYVFRFNSPPLPTLCSMKISALLNRQKGRDFYDVMFLLNKTQPDYTFFSKSLGIQNKDDLKSVLLSTIKNVNLKHKMRDFTHLVFDKDQGKKILLFKDFIEEY
jgi:predicted nucleotidyltransferase component of viral defense system